MLCVAMDYNSQFMSQQMPQTTFPISQPNSYPSNDATNRGQKGKLVDKANWDAKTMEVFIRLCVQEVTNGNRPGTHFGKTGWDNLINKFAIATRRNYNKVQLKNKWDRLKKEWGQWKSLTRGETGLGWNHEKGTVVLVLSGGRKKYR